MGTMIALNHYPAVLDPLTLHSDGKLGPAEEVVMRS
jgi:hypothetical protein